MLNFFARAGQLISLESALKGIVLKYETAAIIVIAPIISLVILLPRRIGLAIISLMLMSTVHLYQTSSLMT